MVAQKTKRKENKKGKVQDSQKPEPWLSMKTGLIIIGIVSVGMAILTAIQVIPSQGVLQGILKGILFGGLIWAIFWGYYLFRRFL
jgi:hypothetical protein